MLKTWNCETKTLKVAVHMKTKRELVSFDWALKKLLRAKANFKVLEGFLSELLRDDITIIEVIESEGNKETKNDKHNRVDVLVKDRLKRHIVIEVQYAREDDYLQRIIYGTAKILTESLSTGKLYKDIARVVSVSIVYFDLGQGEDYVYEGRTEFRGVHRHDRLGLNEFQRSMFHVASVEEVFPEYYILKVNKFDDIARDGLDQWVYFLKNGSIKPSFTGKGLKEAQTALDVMKLSESEHRAYESFLDAQRIEIGVAQSTVLRAEAAEARAEAAVHQKEEAVHQREEAFRQREEAFRQKEEADVKNERRLANALKALIAQGMPEQQARKTLGLDLPGGNPSTQTNP
jgi:predicted transposase/invertase (TIGR01784 family)